MEMPAIKIQYLDDVKFEMTFQDGKVIRFDMSTMFDDFPQLIELRRNRELFLSGKLDYGGDAIVWNDELDFSSASVYESGELVGEVEVTLNQRIGALLNVAREEAGIYQTDLAKKTKIDQGDISRIENGKGNPTIKTLQTLFKAVGKEIVFNTKPISK
jgi:DNA-binding XRE family transcriptional regulator